MYWKVFYKIHLNLGVLIWREYMCIKNRTTTKTERLKILIEWTNTVSPAFDGFVYEGEWGEIIKCKLGFAF